MSASHSQMMAVTEEQLQKLIAISAERHAAEEKARQLILDAEKNIFNESARLELERKKRIADREAREVAALEKILKESLQAEQDRQARAERQAAARVQAILAQEKRVAAEKAKVEAARLQAEKLAAEQAKAQLEKEKAEIRQKLKAEADRVKTEKAALAKIEAEKAVQKKAEATKREKAEKIAAEKAQRYPSYSELTIQRRFANHTIFSSISLESPRSRSIATTSDENSDSDINDARQPSLSHKK